MWVFARKERPFRLRRSKLSFCAFYSHMLFCIDAEISLIRLYCDAVSFHSVQLQQTKRGAQVRPSTQARSSCVTEVSWRLEHA